MKKIMSVLVLVAMASMGSAIACETINAASLIIGSRSVTNLLDKASATLRADCSLGEDEFGSPDLEVNYNSSDYTRSRSGKGTRTFQGTVDCAKDDGSVIRQSIRGTATIKFTYLPENEQCEEMVNEEVLKIKVKMKI